MPSYDVHWSILIDAPDAHAAAEAARAIQLDPSNEAYVYSATPCDDDGVPIGARRTVDLYPEP